MNLNEICKPLNDLWSITSFDWNLDISHCLTEPTCPTICIRPEGTNITRYTTHCDLHEVEDTLIKLVKLVVEEVVEGKVLGRAGHPVTNSDDGIFEQWLNERQTNKELAFPEELHKRASKRRSDSLKD